MSIYRGAGGSSDAVNNASSEATLVQTLVSNATTQAANAATSATAAQAAETQANISKGLAADSATASENSATDSATSAAASLESETQAALSAIAADESAITAEGHKDSAYTYKLAAETAETNAETAQTAAEAAQTAAETAQTAAELAETNAATSETNAASSATAAAASYDSFDDRYLGPKSSNPTVDNDGNALVTGALYFNTTAPEMRVWNGSGWSFIGSGGGAGVESFNTRTGSVTLTSTDVTDALTYTPLAPSAIGSTVQAYDAQLADIAGLTPADNSFIVGNGTNFVAEGASTARTSLGLGTAATTASTDYATAAQGTKADSALQPAAIGVSVQAYDADLDTWSGKTAPSGTVVGTSDSQTLTNKTLTNPTVNGFTGDTSVVNIGSGQVYKDTSGNIGLGSTPTAIGSYKVVEVNGTSGAYLSLRQGGTEYGNIYNNSTDGTTISAAGARNIIYQTNAAERMRIDGSGNVGIGTSSPATKLVVRPATDSNLEVQASTVTTGVQLLSINNARNAYGPIELSGSQDIFYTNGTERMRITSAGDVFIGSSSGIWDEKTGIRLASSGSGAVGIGVYSGSTSYASSCIRVQAENTTGANWKMYEGRGSGGAVNYWVNGAGSAYFAGDMQFNSGYGSTATAYGCRAWVNFNGQGTIAIRASGNVSSLTDNGTGNYTVNFTNALPDDTYAATFGGQYTSANIALAVCETTATTRSTTSLQIRTGNSTAATAVDPAIVSVSVFR